ncbi:MAG: ATP-binding protein [Anaeromyxobacter sp.]
MASDGNSRNAQPGGSRQEHRPTGPAWRPSEAQARTIAQNVRDLLVILDAVRDERGAVQGWRYAEANEAALELLGKGREEVVGRTLAEIMPDGGKRAAPRLGRVLATGEPEQYEATFSGRTLLVKIFRIGADTVGSAAVEITGRKLVEEALRESEERFRVLADAMPQIVCVLGPDGRAEYVNPEWTSFSGLDLAATKRAGWMDLVHPEDLGAAVACRRRALKTLAAQDVELRYRAADGEHRWFQCRLAPIAEGGRVVRLVGAAMNIDDRKRAEQALREADRRKDEFLGMLSHELRNPLAPIRNALFILERADPGEERARRAREVVDRQVAHMTRLVDDLLDVTRIARGKVDLRSAPVDITAVVRRTAEDYRPVLHARRLSLDLDLPREPLVVEGDETRLAQVLGNLLSNAAKFTPAGGRVGVEVEAEARAVAIRVRDTGPGIPLDVLPTLFEPFTQAAQTLARTEGGLGLGLSLVKGLVLLHGGEVVARNGAGGGAEICVTLPLPAVRAAAGGQAGPGRPPLAAASPGRRRVLVVDDNRDAAETLAELVRMLGHEVELAFDGPSALARAQQGHLDIVLCDIGLPGMDGYAVAQALRASGDRAIRLVALSGYAQPEDVARALAAGFDRHVAKPPDPSSIEQLLG